MLNLSKIFTEVKSTKNGLKSVMKKIKKQMNTEYYENVCELNHYYDDFIRNMQNTVVLIAPDTIEKYTVPKIKNYANNQLNNHVVAIMKYTFRKRLPFPVTGVYYSHIYGGTQMFTLCCETNLEQFDMYVVYYSTTINRWCFVQGVSRFCFNKTTNDYDVFFYTSPVIGESTDVLSQLSIAAITTQTVLSLIECQNINLIPNNTIHEKKKKKSIFKKTSVYDLKLDSEKEIRMDHGDFREYTEEKPLFGKHYGRFWVQSKKEKDETPIQKNDITAIQQYL